MAIKKTRFKPPVYDVNGIATYPDTVYLETVADMVKITDTENKFTGENVEAALQEVASDMAALTTQINERTTYGVVTGLGVTAQGTPDMTVKVATGTIYMVDGTRYTPTAVAALAVTATDATNPRIDIVYVNSSGVISYLAGTAEATPSAPSTPAGGMLLATISVAANATTIVAANIVDRKKPMWTEAWITPTLLNWWVEVSGYPIRYMKDSMGFVHLKGVIKDGTLDQTCFSLPVGYKTLNNQVYPTIANNAFAKLYNYTGFLQPNGSNVNFRLDGISFKAEA